MRTLFFTLFSLLIVACGGNAPVAKRNIIKNVPLEAPSLASDVKLSPEGFTQRVVVEFNGGAASLSPLPAGVTAQVTGADVLLRSSVPGVEYVVGGVTERGSLAVVSDFSPLLTIDTLSLRSVGRDALAVSSKEKIYIRGGVARLADEAAAGGVVDKQAAVVSLMGDAVLCGNVNMFLNAARRDAVRSSGVIYVDSASIEVESAAASAVNSTNGVVLAAGEISATAVKDVIKVKKGNFIMLSGALMLAATADKSDAVAARNIYVYGGVVDVDLQGAAAKGLKSKESVFLLGGEINVHTSGGALFAEKKSDYSSSSCIKSALNTYVNNACVSLQSDGDAGKGINCDGLLQVDGGRLRVKTTGNDVNHPIDLNAHASAKGVKCDSTILVNGGDIEILVCGKGERCEGLESKCDIIIAGDDARVYVCAYDDAINAGGNFTLDAGCVYAFSAMNDALDSNAKIDINGGVLIANGAHSPEQGVDCDFERDYTLRGGTLVSVGGAMGPAPVLPKGDETRVAVVSWSVPQVEKDRFVSVATAEGELLLSYCLPRSLRRASVVFASPSIERGGDYSLFMSDSLVGGVHIGCGLYAGGAAVAGDSGVAWRQEELLAVIGDGGEPRFINPDTIKWHEGNGPHGFPPFDGNVPPPPGFSPPPMMDGRPLPPPPGAPFAPFGDDARFEGEYPCRGWE